MFSKKPPDVLDTIYDRARSAHAKVILAEANDERVIKAVQIIEREKLAQVILLDASSFGSMPKEEQTALVQTVRTARPKDNIDDIRKQLFADTKYLAAALVRAGKADGYVAGNKCTTAETIRPALKIIGTASGFASSFFIMLYKGTPLFFADCAFNPAPNPEQLAKIAVDTARNAAALAIEPRVAFLSFSTAGSAAHEVVEGIRKAIVLAHAAAPDIAIAEQELQFDAAFDADVASRKVPGSKIAGHVNVFIFPDLQSGNIGYKIAERLGGAQAIGPILQGFNAPVNDLSRGCAVQDIVDVVAVSAMQAGALKQSNAN